MTGTDERLIPRHRMKLLWNLHIRSHIAQNTDKDECPWCDFVYGRTVVLPHFFKEKKTIKYDRRIRHLHQTDHLAPGGEKVPTCPNCRNIPDDLFYHPDREAVQGAYYTMVRERSGNAGKRPT